MINLVVKHFHSIERVSIWFSDLGRLFYLSDDATYFHEIIDFASEMMGISFTRAEDNTVGGTKVKGWYWRREK